MTAEPAMIFSTGELNFAQGSGLRAQGDCPEPRTPSPEPRVASEGMTLVELLVVLGVIGLIVGMSVPALAGYAKQVRLKAAIRQVVGLVSLARSLAISSHEDHGVVVDPERRELSVINMVSGQALEQVVRLPSSVTLDVQVGGASSPETQLVFRPTGSLTGRTVSLVLADRDKVYSITVTGTTGAVSVK